MNKEELLILFWVFTVLAIAGLGIGIANIISIGWGFITGAICCVIAIPCGIEFDKKFLQ